jgi:hypothetical protein
LVEWDDDGNVTMRWEAQGRTLKVCAPGIVFDASGAKAAADPLRFLPPWHELRFPCSTCGVPVGERCKTRSGIQGNHHASRIAAANELWHVMHPERRIGPPSAKPPDSPTK